MIPVFQDYWLYRHVLYLGRDHEQYLIELKYLIKNMKEINDINFNTMGFCL